MIDAIYAPTISSVTGALNGAIRSSIAAPQFLRRVSGRYHRYGILSA
jgi:hypothetical protein